jgi:hypothetical protein
VKSDLFKVDSQFYNYFQFNIAMIPQEFNPKKALSFVKTIFYAMIGGSILYLCVVFFISEGKFALKFQSNDPLILALIFVSFFTIPLGFYFSRILLKKIGKNDDLEKKFRVYQSYLIVKLASCEGVSLFAIVCLILTKNLICLLFFIISTLIMMGLYPSPEKIGKDVNLNPFEIELF